MTKTWRSRWETLGFCFAGALAWDYVYIEALIYFDPNHRFYLWFAEAPRWVQRLNRWTPGVIAHRILHLFGLRFDMQHYDDNAGFVLLASAVTSFIWTAIFYGVVIFVRRWRHSHAEGAAA